MFTAPCDIRLSSSVAEISWKSFSSNWKTLASKLPEKTGFLAMVKTNAYGHGLGIISDYCHKLGAEALGVANILEALELRALGYEGKILSFGKLDRDTLDAAYEFDIRIVVHSLEDIGLLSAYKRAIVFHLEIETGMNRLGVHPSDIFKVARWLDQTHHIMEGVFTHFAESEVRNSPYSSRQRTIFDEAAIALKKYKRPFVTHLDNSGGIFTHKRHGRWVRPGIALYGFHPSQKAKNHRLEPVLRWYTWIMQIHEIQKGDYVGYNRTFRAEKKMTVATLPVGYGDGFAREYGTLNLGYRNQPCRVVGTVSMDSLMIDVSKIKSPKIGDPVFLMGPGSDQEPDAWEYAKVDRTIPYEVLTRISSRVLRTPSP